VIEAQGASFRRFDATGNTGKGDNAMAWGPVLAIWHPATATFSVGTAGDNYCEVFQ
jgi:hypothetical protein